MTSSTTPTQKRVYHYMTDEEEAVARVYMVVCTNPTVDYDQSLLLHRVASFPLRAS